MAGDSQEQQTEGQAPEDIQGIALAPVVEPAAQADGASADGFAPDVVLVQALERAVAAAAIERAAQPLAVVLQRAHGELQGGGLSDGGRRMLQTALSAANHNNQLSPGTRTALATVAVALRGLS